MQENGIDYLSKEEKGRVRVFGFLRDDVRRIAGEHPHLLDNDRRVIACHRAWMGRIEEHPGGKKFGHKFVMSLDPRFCELMGAAGKDCDALLVHGVRTVLRRFQEKHYPGDRLGYMVGIHHDRQHIHAHVLLFPYTEHGQHLRVTDSGEDKRLRDMRKVADKFIREYFYKEFENPVRLSERPLDKVMQDRTLSFAAWHSFPKGALPESDRPAWAASEKKRLLSLPDAELRQVLQKWHAIFQARFKEVSAKVTGSGTELLQNVGAKQIKLKHQLQETFGRIKEVRAQMEQNKAQLQSAQKEMTNFRSFTARARGIPLSTSDSETVEQRRWLTNLLSNPETAKDARSAMRSKGDVVTYRTMEEFIADGTMVVHVPATQKEAKALEAELRAETRTSRDLLREALFLRMDQIRNERDRLKEEYNRLTAVRDGLNTGLDTLKVQETLFAGAIKGRIPLFLEQIEGMKRANVEIPIVCRPPRPEEVLAKPQVERVASSFEEVNRKIANTLRAFRGGGRSDEEVYEVDHYFRTITEATTVKQDRAGRRQASEADVRKQIEAKGVEQYLLEQNLKKQETAAQAPEAGDRVAAAAKRISKAPEFDL